MGKSNGTSAQYEEVATFALGCKKLKGVLRTRVGYTGGASPNPNHESVVGGDGHTEALRIWFDPSVITYEQLLETFFAEHNPTSTTRPTKHKSILWYHNEGQLKAITAAIAGVQHKYTAPIVTTVGPVLHWTDAEEDHQDWHAKAAAAAAAGAGGGPKPLGLLPWLGLGLVVAASFIATRWRARAGPTGAGRP